MRGAVSPAYSILDFVGQAQQAKGRSKNTNGQINVSCLLVYYQLIFMVNLPQKFEMREFNESLHSSGVNS